MLSMRRAGVTEFDPLPEGGSFQLSWPTGRRDLFSAPESYFARTRANPAYGLPGWTRDCGRRFHRGCDIAPVEAVPAGHAIEVIFSDCRAKTEYVSNEPAWVPRDVVFAVSAGEVVEINGDEGASDFGRFVVVRHGKFHTLYAHLADLKCTAGARVAGGAPLGSMGQTSRSEEARKWMAIAPHLHFEVISASGGAYDPAEFLKRGLVPGK